MFFWKTKDFSILFIHTWKSGGTTVTNAFQQAHEELKKTNKLSLFSIFQAKDINSFYRDYYKNTYFTHQPASDITKYFSSEEWEKAFKFSITRDPLKRLLSMYNFTVKGKHAFYKRVFHAGIPYDDKQFQRVAHDLEENWLAFKELGFKNWLLNSQRMYWGSLSVIPVAKISQHQWFSDESGNLLVDKIYKLEELNLLAKDVQEMYDINLNLGHDNKRKYNQDLTIFEDPEIQDFMKKYHLVDLEQYAYNSKTLPITLDKD